MTLATLTSLVAQMVGDPDQTRYSGLYTSKINRAQEQFALDSKCLWKDTTYTSANGDADYNLPSDFMFEEWVRFNSKPLQPISRTRLAELNPKTNWTDDTGTPTHYIIDPEEAVKELLLYPIPQADDASKTISMRYYPIPAEMTTGSDVPLNSSALLAQFHPGIAAYAGWLLMLGERASAETLAKRTELLSVYNDMVSKAVDTFKNTVTEPLRMRPQKAWWG